MRSRMLALVVLGLVGAVCAGVGVWWSAPVRSADFGWTASAPLPAHVVVAAARPVAVLGQALLALGAGVVGAAVAAAVLLARPRPAPVGVPDRDRTRVD